MGSYRYSIDTHFAFECLSNIQLFLYVTTGLAWPLNLDCKLPEEGTISSGFIRARKVRKGLGGGRLNAPFTLHHTQYLVLLPLQLWRDQRKERLSILPLRVR